MEKSFKKIAVLILSLAIVLGSVLCLSSCSNMVFEIISTIMENGDSTDGSTDQGGDGLSDGTSGSNSCSSSGDSSLDSEGKNDQTPSNPSTPSIPGGESGGNTSGGETGTTDGDTDVEFYPNQGSTSAENVAAKNRTLLSTVVIVSHFGNSPSAGSGVIYSIDKEKGDAYIITNYHVVYSDSYGICDVAKLYLYGMRYENYEIPATFVGGSATYDIAVLKVEGSEVLKNSYAVAADFGDSEQVRVFDEVFVVGNPEGYGMAVTEGIVSVDSESLEMDGADGSPIELRVMRVSAAINRGNSGGGLYANEGKLIGIVVAKRVGSDIDNIGYAIPSNLAKNLVDNIIYFCSDGSKTTIQRPLIGITITAKVVGVVIDEETGEVIKAEKIEISELSDTCIAKDLVAVGDVVNSITVNGVTVSVTRLHHVIDHMLTARVGTTVVMNITRGEETLDVTFTVPETAFTSVK